jgi:predicted enzyme related to lactoylglutathione lyase
MTTPRANSYIGITTEKFKETADFYIQHFGYSINAEAEGFIVIQSPNQKRTLGFSAPSNDKGLIGTFSGGIHLPFLVDDIEAALAGFKRAGVSVTRNIKTENWGEKHFVVTDPAGVELYISEGSKEVTQGV